MDINKETISVWLKNAVMAAGDVLMQGFGTGADEAKTRDQAKTDSRDTILASFMDEWFAAGGEEIAILADGFDLPKIAWREGSSYTTEDDHEDMAFWRGPCIAVDALRGSLAYSRGIRDFCASAAFINEGELVASVVFDPSAVELYHAVNGLGAYLNGKTLHVSQQDDLKQAFISIDEYAVRSAGCKELQGLTRKVQQLRTAPAVALEMCYAASGRTDAYIAADQSFFSYAAGLLVASEAGAKVCDFLGDPGGGVGILGQRKNLLVCGQALLGQLQQHTSRF